jgi:hypothetical protein
MKIVIVNTVNKIRGDEVGMKMFEQLVINHMNCEDEPDLRLKQKIAKTREIFESEMLRPGEKPTHKHIEDWLRGLASSCSIPFMNFEIIDWYEWYLDRPIKQNEEHKLVERYWISATQALANLWGVR